MGGLAALPVGQVAVGLPAPQHPPGVLLQGDLQAGHGALHHPVEQLGRVLLPVALLDLLRDPADGADGLHLLVAGQGVNAQLNPGFLLVHGLELHLAVLALGGLLQSGLEGSLPLDRAVQANQHLLGGEKIRPHLALPRAQQPEQAVGQQLEKLHVRAGQGHVHKGVAPGHLLVQLVPHRPLPDGLVEQNHGPGQTVEQCQQEVGYAPGDHPHRPADGVLPGGSQQAPAGNAGVLDAEVEDLSSLLLPGVHCGVRPLLPRLEIVNLLLGQHILAVQVLAQGFLVPEGVQQDSAGFALKDHNPLLLLHQSLKGIRAEQVLQAQGAEEQAVAVGDLHIQFHHPVPVRAGLLGAAHPEAAALPLALPGRGPACLRLAGSVAEKRGAVRQAQAQLGKGDAVQHRVQDLLGGPLAGQTSRPQELGRRVQAAGHILHLAGDPGAAPLSKGGQALHRRRLAPLAQLHAENKQGGNEAGDQQDHRAQQAVYSFFLCGVGPVHSAPRIY